MTKNLLERLYSFKKLKEFLFLAGLPREALSMKAWSCLMTFKVLPGYLLAQLYRMGRRHGLFILWKLKGSIAESHRDTPR